MPTQLLRRPKDLGGDSFTESRIHPLWIARLPINIQTIPTSQKNAPIETTATFVDKILKISP